MSRDQLENDIKRACDIMRRDNNCGGVLQYIEHLAWVLFLKFLDDQEKIFRDEAELAGKEYEPLIESPYRWSDWVPKALGELKKKGKRATPEWDGEKLMQFVNGDLLPHLAELQGSDQREVISGLFNGRNVVVCDSPYNLKDVLEIIDAIDFRNADDIDTVSKVYEELLLLLGRENNIAGEFYTPRPVVRFIVRVIAPQIGETVYDPACGTCGFLTFAYDYMKKHEKQLFDREVLQTKTFIGNEKKSLSSFLGMINMILHGVIAPEIRRRNTLEENVKRGVDERFDVIITNPPFGGTENEKVQKNFKYSHSATELLFVQHIMKKLKNTENARCGMVVPEGTLFRSNKSFQSVKKKLLEDFNLHFVLSLPPGTFSPYSDVKTGLLFFESEGPTEEVLYYEMPLPEGLKKFSKGSPIEEEHFGEAWEVFEQWKAYREGDGDKPERTENTWIESVEDLVNRGYDLSAKNPTPRDRVELPPPEVVLEELIRSSEEFHERLLKLKEKLMQREGV